MSLKIASINVEVSKHTERVLAFLAREKPDVLCLQELAPSDIHTIEDAMGAAYGSMVYAPVNSHGRKAAIGIGIVSPLPFTDVRICGYTGQRFPRETRPGVIDEMLVLVTVNDGSTDYRIGTTHMRVTKQGRVTPAQMRSVRDLINTVKEEVREHHGLLLTGDFNAPRGRKAFDSIAKVLNDGIPPHHVHSVDPILHRIYREGQYKNPDKLQRMVDGFFYSSEYIASNVKLHTGVSDHCAVTGTITSLNP